MLLLFGINSSKILGYVTKGIIAVLFLTIAQQADDTFEIAISSGIDAMIKKINKQKKSRLPAFYFNY